MADHGKHKRKTLSVPGTGGAKKAEKVIKKRKKRNRGLLEMVQEQQRNSR